MQKPTFAGGIVLGLAAAAIGGASPAPRPAGATEILEPTFTDRDRQCVAALLPRFSGGGVAEGDGGGRHNKRIARCDTPSSATRTPPPAREGAQTIESRLRRGSGGGKALPYESSESSSKQLGLRTVLAAAPEIEIVLSDVTIPANSAVPRHYHSGEELVYVIAGDVFDVEEGHDKPYGEGEGFIIAPGKAHAPRAGAAPVRAITVHVVKKGEPERVLVE